MADSLKLKFLKDHVSGIGKGSVIKARDAEHAERLVEEKVAEVADEKAAYKIIPSHVADPGKEARGKKQKKALEEQKKAKAIRAQKHKQP